MEQEGALVIDLGEAEWAENAQAMLSELASTPPAAVHINAEAAPAPSVEQAQLLAMIAKHAGDNDIALQVSDTSTEFTEGMARLGLANVMSD